MKKYFSYELEPKLFKRLEFATLKFKRGLHPMRPGNVHKEIERELANKERMFRRMDREVQRSNQRYQKPDIDLSPLSRRGSINFGFRLGF